MIEIEYIPIPDFPGFAVSYCGKVIGLDRTIIRKNGSRLNIKSKPIKISSGYTSYLTVHLSDNNIKHLKLVHRLVAIAWIPNPNNYPFVLHKDDNPLNPHGDNLFWGNYSINLQDCYNKKRRKVKIRTGFANKMCKLSKKDVKIIRCLATKKFKKTEIAKRFNIAVITVFEIIKRKTHK